LHLVEFLLPLNTVCKQSVEFLAVKRGVVSQLPEDGRKRSDMMYSFTATVFPAGGSGFTSLHCSSHFSLPCTFERFTTL